LFYFGLSFFSRNSFEGAGGKLSSLCLFWKGSLAREGTTRKHDFRLKRTCFPYQKSEREIHEEILFLCPQGRI